MDKKWQTEQLGLIKEGKSIFGFIPDNIGELCFCDTTNERAVPYTLEEAKQQRTTALIVGLVALPLIWYFLLSHYIIASILTLIVLFICWIIFDTSFKGKDFFVGDRGFAVFDFDKDRKNFTQKKVILFDDMSHIISGEIRKYERQKYGGSKYKETSFFFGAFSKPKESGEEYIYKSLHSETGIYEDENPRDEYYPRKPLGYYSFTKFIEKMWTYYFVNMHDNEEVVTFPVSHDGRIAFNIALSPDIILIGDKQYTAENTKSRTIQDGKFIIEDVNHEKKFLGLKEEGDMHVIPLSEIGNSKAFLYFYNKYYK